MTIDQHTRDMVVYGAGIPTGAGKISAIKLTDTTA
jgi:hypothetical protein